MIAGKRSIQAAELVILKLIMQPKKLEHYKFFAPIAWTLCLSFAGFVGLLALQVNDTIQDLESSSISFDQRLDVVEKAVDTNPL